MVDVKGCGLIKRFFLFAFVLMNVAGAAVVVNGAPSGQKKVKTPQTPELEGYFVRIKSGVSGEKQIYYNKDGSLRSSLGGGLFDGDFSLDKGLLSGGDELDLSFSPSVPENFKKPSASTPTESPSPAPESLKKEPAPAKKTTREKTTADEGTVDEHSILKKFSREEKKFGLNQNFKKIMNMDANDRYREAFTLREWQGSTNYGMRHALGMDRDYEMDASSLGEKSVDMGLFDTRSSLAGDRMFVRNREGLFEVRLNDRFSSSDVLANERAKNFRESSGFSMQDINRYQFRRNRSSDPGLPVVSPSSKGNVRKEAFGGKPKK